ncbi:MAG: PEPxxWA-CTERM sorting domain-containing protein, partial [Polymorphobacter sp.]
SSATAGTVQMIDFGWDFTGGAIGHAEVNQGTNWEYYFTPASNAVLTWNYNVWGTGNVFGLWGFQLYVDGVGYGATTDPYDPNSNGTFTINLAGGQGHYLSLATNANIDAGGDPSGYMHGHFDWAIAGATVPEPASWALLIAGFGMIGGALRARRHALA